MAPATTRTRDRGETLRREDARRLLLHTHGLLDDPGRRATAATLRRIVERIGFVQLDSIQVVARGHDLILASRLDGYRPHHLRHLIERRKDLFEHWTHDASAIPTAWFVPWRHRCRRMAEGAKKSPWFQRRLGKGGTRRFARVKARIADEGPLMSKDFQPSSRAKSPSGGWWTWKPDKAALDFLWWRGDLSVVGRRHFHKVYDLTERAYPHAAEAAAREPLEEPAFVEWACREAFARLVVATPREISRFHAAVSLDEARRHCDTALAEGTLVRVRVEGNGSSAAKAALALPDWRRRVARAAKALGEAPSRMRLLSPFDPVIRDRGRAERLFDFAYRFEAFVPAPKRRYGYYVLPVLHGERLVGRVDLKHDRKDESLVVLGRWWEPGRGKARWERQMLGEALERLATTVGATRMVDRLA